MKTAMIPKVKARVVRNEYGQWDIYIICPFCGKEHHHGGGNGARANLGARAAHCTGSAKVAFQEYEIL